MLKSHSRKESTPVPFVLATIVCMAIGAAVLGGGKRGSIVSSIDATTSAESANTYAQSSAIEIEQEISYPAVSDPQSLGKHLAFRASQELAAGGTSNYDPGNPQNCEHQLEALLNALRVLTYDADPINLIQKGVIKVLVNRQDPSVFKIFIPGTGVSVHVSQGGIQTAYFKAGPAIETPAYRNFTAEDSQLLKIAWSKAREIFKGKGFETVVQEVIKAFYEKLSQLGITVGCKPNQ